MKILVTGATGFVGQNLIPILQTTNQEIYGISSKVDLREMNKVVGLFWEVKPDVVIHLAAKVGGIKANAQSPAQFISDNLLMGVNLIETAYKFYVKKFIMLGTVCSYPKFCPTPFQEKNLWNGYPEETNAPYGIAKKTLNEMLVAFHKEYGFDSTTLVPTNMYGPHDNFNLETSHVIPALIRKIDEAKKNNTPLEVWGTGEASREFLYVKDCCQAIIRALATPTDPYIINVGNGFEVKIKELLDMLCDIMGFNGEIQFNGQMDGQPRRCLDISRAKSLLDYQPTCNLRYGLERTIDYYYENIGNL